MESRISTTCYSIYGNDGRGRDHKININLGRHHIFLIINFGLGIALLYYLNVFQFRFAFVCAFVVFALPNRIKCIHI